MVMKKASGGDFPLWQVADLTSKMAAACSMFSRKEFRA
jgi:hypothetical protein